MSAHSQHDRAVVHREWTLKIPAHSSDVAKAITEACHIHGRDADATSDVTVRTEDDELMVIGYTTQRDARTSVALRTELAKLREAHDVLRKRLADALGVGWDRSWDQLIESAAGVIGAVVIQRDTAEADLAEARAEILRFRIANGDAPADHQTA